jgi:hypothetical protein
MRDFDPFLDCEFYEAFDEGDDYPPVIKCEKANEWIEDTLPCYDCEGKWSIEQIEAYIGREETKIKERLKAAGWR